MRSTSHRVPDLTRSCRCGQRLWYAAGMVAWIIMAAIYVPLLGVAFIRTVARTQRGVRAHRTVRTSCRMPRDAPI